MKRLLSEDDERRRMDRTLMAHYARYYVVRRRHHIRTSGCHLTVWATIEGNGTREMWVHAMTTTTTVERNEDIQTHRETERERERERECECVCVCVDTTDGFRTLPSQAGDVMLRSTHFLRRCITTVARLLLRSGLFYHLSLKLHPLQSRRNKQLPTPQVFIGCLL